MCFLWLEAGRESGSERKANRRVGCQRVTSSLVAQARDEVESRRSGIHLDPKFAPVLVPIIMAFAMSFTMSFVMTIVRLGFAPNFLSVWLTSFAIGVTVAIPTAIVIAPQAQRLARLLARSQPGLAPEMRGHAAQPPKPPAVDMKDR